MLKDYGPWQCIKSYSAGSSTMRLNLINWTTIVNRYILLDANKLKRMKELPLRHTRNINRPQIGDVLFSVYRGGWGFDIHTRIPVVDENTLNSHFFMSNGSELLYVKIIGDNEIYSSVWQQCINARRNWIRFSS